MKPVAREEILGLADYEAIRPLFRSRVIAQKKRRRFAVGPHASVVFENHDTALLQIHEMLRAERITNERAILHEIATYNRLVPGPAELSATFMFEIAGEAEREAFLRRAKDVEKHMRLLVDGVGCPAAWDPEREHTERTSAVHYLRVPLPAPAVAAIRAAAARVDFVVDHGAYRHAAEAPREVVRSLAGDLE